MPSHTEIVDCLLLGFAATLGTIVIHGFVVHTIVMALRRNLLRGVLGMRIRFNLAFVMSATLLAFIGHLVEISFWAFALDLLGAVAGFSEGVYASAGNYTTLGSDVVLPLRWKLVGPIEAVCGMLMFGVSTALIFAVLQRLIHARFEGDDNIL